MREFRGTTFVAKVFTLATCNRGKGLLAPDRLWRSLQLVGS